MTKYCCENCKREVEKSSLHMLTIDGHFGYVCPTCHHIFSKEYNHVRFKENVRSKTYAQSNAEMKAVHHKMSALISFGLVSFFIVVSAMVVMMFNQSVTLP